MRYPLQVLRYELMRAEVRDTERAELGRAVNVLVRVARREERKRGRRGWWWLVVFFFVTALASCLFWSCAPSTTENWPTPQRDLAAETDALNDRLTAALDGIAEWVVSVEARLRMAEQGARVIAARLDGAMEIGGTK